ncbi:MAG: hypothetical protein ABSH34_19625 [Verrucomicrobiota bacterium]
MKRILTLSLALGSAMALAVSARAQTFATLADYGTTAPTPGPNDIAQLVAASGANSPDGLNYYFDNSVPPGQTFTTGSNASGYTLGSLSILTADNSGQLPAGGQAYYLRIYSVSGTTATLMATYVSTNNFTFIDNDWLQWTGLNTVMAPNAQYAYSFGRISSGAGWENLSNVGGDLYAGGEVALIPVAGGAMTLGSSDSYDATFVVGLNPVTTLIVSAPTATPQGVVAGTAASLNETAAGPGTLQYQWRTDGASGGARTNISAATSASLALDTTGYAPGFYRYDVVVTSGSMSVTSAVVILGITAPAAAATLTDLGALPSPQPYDITQFVGGGNPTSGDGLNYYDDNGANHDGWAGQTFTTGTNSKGYYLTSVAFQTGGTSGSTSTVQGYDLYLFLMDGNIAIPMAQYTNGSFSFADGDWLQWSGFNLTLQPNTTYAYGFGRSSTGTGWAGLAVSLPATDLYPGGQICTIPAEGGPVAFGTSGLSDGVFDLGLLPIGVGPSPLPFGGLISPAPSSTVAAGAQVTLSQAATGSGSLHFQWQADGGSGGALTNIPSANGSNLVVDTTGWPFGTYSYDFVVTNSFGSSTSMVVALSVLYAITPAVLTDMGSAAPVPEGDDIAQLTPASTYSSPDGLNYYFDNSLPPGQTFTTGSEPNGYTLTSVAIKLAGNNGGSLPAAGQAYLLRLYEVSGGNAILNSILTSQDHFTFTTMDWLRFSGFTVPLAANTTYAYSLGRSSSGSGWENLSNVSGDPYAGGEVALIPTGGGTITFGSSHGFDGTFMLSLDVPGHPVLSPLTFSPGSVVYAGTPVTISPSVAGTGPFTYQWQTDGGNTGGVLTNIPAAIGPTLAVNTASLGGQAVVYAVIVGNAAGSTAVADTLTVQPPSPPILINDISSTSATKFSGGSLTVTTTFDGTLPIFYQWQVNKGASYVNVAGQTNASLVLPNLQASDSGTYVLNATNSLGANSSSVFTLAVWQVPTTPFTVNFQWHSTEGGNDVGTYSGPGIPGFGSGADWNQVVGPNAWAPGTYASTTGFLDDGSADTGISWTLTTGGSWDWSSTPKIALLDSSASAYATQPFTFSLPNGMYDMVLFSCNGTESSTDDAAALFTINGMTATAVPTQDTSFVESNNYVVFSQVLVANTTLAGTWGPTDGKGYGSLNGAQLRYVGPAVTLHSTPLAAGQFQLQWPQGTLLEAPTLKGPWTTNLNTSPYMVNPTAAQMFYRVQVK